MKHYRYLLLPMFIMVASISILKMLDSCWLLLASPFLQLNWFMSLLLDELANWLSFESRLASLRHSSPYCHTLLSSMDLRVWCGLHYWHWSLWHSLLKHLFLQGTTCFVYFATTSLKGLFLFIFPKKSAWTLWSMTMLIQKTLVWSTVPLVQWRALFERSDLLLPDLSLQRLRTKLFQINRFQSTLRSSSTCAR